MKRVLAAIALAILTTSADRLDAQAIPAPPVQGASAPDPSEIVGEPSGKRLTGDALELETKRVSALLRCPVCQGLSVFDSPAEMARNMKIEVRDLLARGYTGEQILKYFETSYGEFVRLQPPLRGVNWLVWISPFVALLLGGWIMLVRLRSRPNTSTASDESLASSQLLDESLAPYLASVRRMAYDNPDDSKMSAAPNPGPVTMGDQK
ncbi:MAG TPA: cytochrome c-type biogenesis protein CcmH [Thermoanaerobaculia bacterium]|nr:cytochrome c-type biogenesis protein CcmH [Thermoanaerobaculia bacterium]